MSWLPTALFWIGIVTPVVWLWTGETRRPGSSQAILVVFGMLLAGVLATAMLVLSIGSAGVAQLGIGALSLVLFLVILGYFGLQVGTANVVEAIVPF